MDDLVQFLRDRLGEDERAARLMAEFYPTPWETSDRGWMARVMADAPTFREVVRLEQWQQEPGSEEESWLGDIIDHVARHDPARVLAEVDVKRRVLAEVVPAMDDMQEGLAFEYGSVGPPKNLLSRDLLKLLALPYAGHPDYREEWRPSIPPS
jgi:hypothetical protein